MNPKTMRAGDGREMVLIPGGAFRMGSREGYPEERPVHTVTLYDFYMDRYPVTNAAYKAFCDAAGKPCPADPRWPDMPDYFLGYPEYPVVNVSWSDAAAYARWAGKRLPSEEEWEYAAAGGLDAPDYPWGDGEPDGGNANFADVSSDYPWSHHSICDGFGYTSPAGAFPANGYGLFDMAGNVFEWTEDWFFRYDDELRDTERFKDGWGGSKVCRGGCYHSVAGDLRVARRRQVLGGGANMAVGFRCAADLPGHTHRKKVEFEVAAKPVQWMNKIAENPLRIEAGLELCIGIGSADPETLRHLKNIGVTSVEQYVTWETVENGGEGCFDFSKWDAEAEKIRSAGLKWLPFLIAGPAYSLPDWYRSHRDFEGLCCREHNIESKIQSYFDKRFLRYVERFIRKFSGHYADHSLFEGVLLGINGDFGEAIMPDWHGNWPTQIAGLYHSHAGYWSNDRFARADFRTKMKRRFRGDLQKLNAAWGTDFRSFDSVEMPRPVTGRYDLRTDEHTGPGSFAADTPAARRRVADYVDWYRRSMTDYALFCMKTARKHFPDTPVYLCTGGDGVPWHAADFSAQCKAAARVGGGIRITNEASDYEFNFVVTNQVASAGTHYGAYYSFEPAGQVTERGAVCRIYNAAATGAKGLHYYAGNILDGEEKYDRYRENIGMFRPGKIIRDIALLYPDTPMVIDGSKRKEFYNAFRLLRDFSDYAFADDLTIRDGILDNVKALVIPVGGDYRTGTLRKIKAFVKNGGILAGIDLTELRGLEDDRERLHTLFTETGKKRARLFHTGGEKGVFGENPTAETVDSLFESLAAFLSENGVYVPDGRRDRVYTALKDGGLCVLNYSGNNLVRSFKTTGGGEVAAELKDNAITALSFKD